MIRPRTIQVSPPPSARTRSGACPPARRDLVQKLLPPLFENESVLAVDKPAGVDVGGGDASDTEGVVEILNEARRSRHVLAPVNRLSRYESGVLLLAKDPKSARQLRSAVRRSRAKFEYLAICRGKMPRSRITLGEEASARSSRQAPADRAAIRGKKVTRQATPPAKAQHRTVLRRLAESSSRVLVQCRTEVPTTHQLRAQLRSANLRVVGDTLHDRARRKVRPQETLLHLSRLALDAPGEHLTLRTSAFPSGVEAILESSRCLERPLHAALVRRLPLLVERDTDAHRLLIGSAEDLAGVAVERFGDVLVVYVDAERGIPAETLEDLHRWYSRMLGTRSTYLKTSVRHGGGGSGEIERRNRNRRPLAGKVAPEEVVIRERGLFFAIRPYAGFSVGLFLDQRDNRSWIRKHAAGRELLNLFAYTCGFSVAAAMGGAYSTVNVDISPRSLEWGRRNFALNGLSAGDHQFVADDALKFLRKTAKKRRCFDMIIVDPPSFAHGRKRGGRFSIMEDLGRLIAESARCLRAGGHILVGTNHRKMSPRMLRDRVRAGFGDRRFKVLDTPPLPRDFAIDPDYARSLIVEAG